MDRVRFPKPIRLPADAYENPENLFHVVIHALEDQTPFRGAVGQRVWELLLAEREGRHVGLVAACLMPTHLHLLAKPAERPLTAWIRSFKSLSTKLASNDGRTSAVWQPGFFDSRIPDEVEYEATLRYLIDNPVEGGLVKEPDGWPWLFYPGQP